MIKYGNNKFLLSGATGAYCILTYGSKDTGSTMQEKATKGWHIYKSSTFVAS